MTNSDYPFEKSKIVSTLTIIALLLLNLLLFVPSIGSAEINVDGRLDEPEWTESQSFTDFFVIEPLTYDTPPMQTETRIISLPEGLAVAFICEQPEETRTRTITQRDPERFDSDAVSLMIDFDGKGEKIHQFSVSLSGSYLDGTLDRKYSLNKDWDGLWQRAVYEDEEHWTVEILLPWSIVAMQGGSGDTRRLGIFFQRDVYASGESFAFPKTSTALSQFITDLAMVEVQLYSNEEFNIWPYATVLSDQVNDSIKGKAGVDLFWKPSGSFQVAATFNPDFGQVESDDLVIDFSAIEVMFSDKRPFFTENQSIFEDALVKNESVFYTRRVGGPRDDNRGASDIDGALKVIGSAGSLNYGFFAAKEADADDVGRSFYDGRLVFPGKTWLVGTQTTYTERPFLGRSALVNALNYDIKPGENWRVLGQFISSKIDVNGSESDGFGSFNAVQYTPNDHWHFELSLIHYDDTLDINDMGYLRRNDLVEWFFAIDHHQTDFPESSRTASVSWMMFSQFPKKTDGTKLMQSVMIMRNQRMRSGSNISLSGNFLRKGYDDLISRGNGLVHLNNQWSVGLSYRTPKRGAWRKSVGINMFKEGYEDWGMGLETGVTWYPYEKLNLDLSLRPRWSRDWLIWLQGNQLASFSRRQVSSEISANWFPAEGHEVRLRTQWLTINADDGKSYRIASGGHLVPDSEMVNDFAMINFGLQIRYRYEIAPLSDFYLVYSRGGLERINDPSQSTIDLLGDSTSIRNADQIIIKLRYGF